MEDILLKATGISKSFDGIKALKKASLEVKRGEIHALVGANGAGKSTIIKIISGAIPMDEGEIYFDGKKINVKSTYEARELGISVVYQEFSLINTLTVAENIFLGKLKHKKDKKRNSIDWKRMNKEAREILKQLKLDIDPQTRVGKLSVAQKQLVEIAKALTNNIKILIMDEPSASLSDNEIENMFNVIRDLKKKGISIIYVSHRLEELPMISDRITIFRDGQYIKTLNIEDAPKHVIIENMVGNEVVEVKQSSSATKEKLLSIRNFSSGNKFKNISFDLYKGEILGIAGLAGAGRTELVRAIFGADPKDSGEVYINGKKVKIKNPRDAIKNHIGFVTEDRKEEGLILNMSLANNMGMTILDKLTKFFHLNIKKESKLMDEYIESLSIKCSSGKQPAKALSGGNQQKVVISKWLATNPKILIMDEPTRGIDVGSKNQIYELLNQLASQGIGIILISSELPEILQVSNRIIVLAEGKLTAELDNKDITQEVLLHYATSKIAV